MTPEQRVQLAYQVEKANGLPKGMLVGQLYTESGNGKNNYNPTSGATGPMQFLKSTAAQFNIDPSDDEQSIKAAGTYMKQLLQRTNGNVAQALNLYGGSKKGTYAPTVSQHWDDSDAFDAAMSGNKQAPQEAVPTGGEPAKPDTNNDDDEAVFSTAMGGNPPQADTSAPQEEEDPKLAQLRQGIETVATLTKSPMMVRRFIQDSGYDPDSLKNLDENVTAGTVKPGAHWWQQGMQFAATPLPHDTVSDLSTGFNRGTDDVFGTLNQFVASMDKRYPLLASIDNAAHGVTGLPNAQGYSDLSQANILNRKAYDANFDSFSSGAGRLGGQVVASAPMMAAGAQGVTALAPEAAAPAVDFVMGRGGGNLLARAASRATAGGILGGVNNALTASASDDPLGQRVEQGATVGAVAGPVLGAVGDAATNVANRVAPGVDAATARLAQIAKDKYGFNLGGDQITNSPLVRKVSAMMDLNPVNNNLARDAEQRAQFTRAVGRTFGADADELTPEVMSAARKNIGSQMDAIAARNPIHVDDNLLTDLGDIENTYKAAVTDQEMKPIQTQLDNVLSAAKTGNTIDGETYQRLVAKGSPLDKAINSANPNIRGAAIDIRGALDDAMERSATASGNGADVDALRAARLKYKNLMTVAPLVSKDTGNQITPSLLNNRVSVNFKNRAFQGAGDLDELAQIGKRFLTPPNTSGTPEGIRANRIIENASTGTALGLMAGGHLLGYGNAGDVAGLSLLVGRKAVGAGSNAILKKLIQSDAYKNLLLRGALDADTPASVNLLPMFAKTGVNRLANAVAYPAPQPAQQ